MKNVYWLIDGSYLYKSMIQFRKIISNFNIDYKKLKDKLEKEFCVESEKLISYYFNSTPNPATDAQNAFHSWLKCAPPVGPNIRVELYSLKKGFVKCKKCNEMITNYVQKGVDVGIVTAALKYCNKYDKLIVSAGDGDFKDTFKYLSEELDKEIIILSFKHGLSTDLQQYSSRVLFMDDFYNEISDSRGKTPPPFDQADEIIVEDIGK